MELALVTSVRIGDGCLRGDGLSCGEGRERMRMERWVVAVKKLKAKKNLAWVSE